MYIEESKNFGISRDLLLVHQAETPGNPLILRSGAFTAFPTMTISY